MGHRLNRSEPEAFQDGGQPSIDWLVSALETRTVPGT